MPLYEKHGLCFVTAVFQICPAYVDRGGEINFIDVFGFLRCFYHSMSGYQFAETCFFTPAHPVKLFDFFQRKIFFRKIGCKTDIGSVIKTNPDDSKFNIVIRTAFIEKIKIRRRLEDGISIRIARCFFCMTSGKCCSYISIEFAARQIIGRKNTITVDILHADNELHSLPDQMCKSPFVKRIACNVNIGSIASQKPVTVVKVVRQSTALHRKCMN